jgi:ADP-heptose:LPS heptosyltransferase
VRVLLIRLRLIGDVVLSTPLIRALRRTFPDASLNYLVERDAAAVVSGNPHLDEVIVVERTRGLTRIADDLRLARRLRRMRFDVVIDMHGGPRSSWLTLATGAPQRIGYDIAGRHWMYTRTVPRARELRPRHSVVNQWDLLSAIDGWTGGAPDPACDAVEMPLDSAADRRVAERLQGAGVEPGHELIVVHVSASNPFRRWPEPAFVEVVSSLVRESPDRRIVLSSGPSDRPAADRIAASARDRTSVSSTSPSSARWSAEAACSSAVIPVRCMSRRPPSRRLWRFTGPRSRHARHHGDRTTSPLNRSKWRAWRVVRVISVCARQGITGA